MRAPHRLLDGLEVRAPGHVMGSRGMKQNMGVKDKTSRPPFAEEAALCYHIPKPVSWAIQAVDLASHC